MSTPQHIFALTKNEQRVVIVIMILLLAGTVTKRYRDVHSHLPLPPATTAPSPPLSDEDQTAPDGAADH
jgi:hypothetical protein